MNDVINLKDDVFVIKNFMTPEECSAVIKYLDDCDQSGRITWNPISFYESYAKGFFPFDQELIKLGLEADYFNKLRDKVKLISEKAFGRELTEITFHAQKWIEGSYASYHSDNTDSEGNPTPFSKSKYASFIYLNDNFTGGLLKFKNFDIEIKPEIGMLAIFDGGFGNEHKVTTVDSGERYTLGSFWDNADSIYTDEIKAKWEEDLKKIREAQAEEIEEWKVMRESGVKSIERKDL